MHCFSRCLPAYVEIHHLTAQTPCLQILIYHKFGRVSTNRFDIVPSPDRNV